VQDLTGFLLTYPGAFQGGDIRCGKPCKIGDARTFERRLDLRVAATFPRDEPVAHELAALRAFPEGIKDRACTADDHFCCRRRDIKEQRKAVRRVFCEFGNRVDVMLLQQRDQVRIHPRNLG
jgi:hypothetical protein